MRIEADENLVAGTHVVQGYLEPAHDGTTKVRDASGTVWHRTGDAGRIAPDGSLWLLGRIDARVGGLWPFVVEAHARTWSGVRRVALACVAGKPVLAIEGDPAHLPRWRAEFARLCDGEVRRLKRIPVDRRHGAKIDQAKLMLALNAAKRDDRLRELR